MSTEFELMVPGEDTLHTRGAAQAAFTEIDRLDGLLSRFDPRSDISRINRLQPGESLRVGIEVIECLDMGFRLREETFGAFDMDFRSRGIAGGEDSLPVELIQTSSGFKVTAVRGVDLDLGGIGKGYALDQVRDILEDWDIEDALLHAGTSTALAWGDASGAPQDSGGWPVGVAGTWAGSGIPGRAFLKDRALSGSGTEVKGEHVHDPGTGRPAAGHRAAWASHTSAAVADAMSTSFMVLDTERVAEICRRDPGLWALVINEPKKCTIFNRGTVAAETTR
jgi:thiamine biosynthesis lipoprotein